MVSRKIYATAFAAFVLGVGSGWLIFADFRQHPAPGIEPVRKPAESDENKHTQELSVVHQVPVSSPDTDGDHGRKTRSKEEPLTERPALEPGEWSDAELGLDLDRPWDEINIFEVVDWNGYDHGLTKEQMLERGRRVSRLKSSDRAYWSKRHDLQALEAGLAALRDENSTLGMINSRVNLGLGLVSYWLMLPNGDVWPMEGEAPFRLDGQPFDSTGAVLTPGGTFRYAYMTGEYPVIEDWNAYRDASSRLPKSAVGMVPKNFSSDLRRRLIESFEYAITMQRATVPVPLKLDTRSQDSGDNPK
jgi:hypothetical protein